MGVFLKVSQAFQRLPTPFSPTGPQILSVHGSNTPLHLLPPISSFFLWNHWKSHIFFWQGSGIEPCVSCLQGK